MKATRRVLFIVLALASTLDPSTRLFGVSKQPISPPRTVARVAVPTGPEGSSAPLWVRQGARIEKLVAMIRVTFSVVVDAWRSIHGPTPVITSGTDGVHHSGSLHYSGRAIDLRAKNLELAQARAARDYLQSHLTMNHGAFSRGQLRTLQRRPKDWRREMARELLFGASVPDTRPPVMNGSSTIS